MRLFGAFGAVQRPPTPPVFNVEQLFALADLNKDGKLDFNEWLLMLMLLAPTLLALFQQHAASPCGSRLLGALRRARHADYAGGAGSGGSAFSMAHDQKVHENTDGAAPARQARLLAYAEDPGVALLIRRSIAIEMRARREPRLGS